MPDKTTRARLWQPVRGPGGVLVDGAGAGTWRARTTGKRLEVTVQPFAALTPTQQDAIHAEADLLASFRDSETAQVTFTA